MDGGLSQIGSFTLFVEPNTRRHTVSTLSTGFGSGYLFLYFRSGFLVERNGQTQAEEERVVLARQKVTKVTETILSQ